jgi:hypothetical protein
MESSNHVPIRASQLNLFHRVGYIKIRLGIVIPALLRRSPSIHPYTRSRRRCSLPSTSERPPPTCTTSSPYVPSMPKTASCSYKCMLRSWANRTSTSPRRVRSNSSATATSSTKHFYCRRPLRSSRLRGLLRIHLSTSRSTRFRLWAWKQTLLHFFTTLLLPY